MSGTWGSPNVQPWRDDFARLQDPDVTPVDDLSKFVIARIIAAETEPRSEVPQAYNQPAGPMAHRYAAHVRRDMVAFRKIVAQYIEIRAALNAETDPERQHLLTGCALGIAGPMSALAERWADHPDFRDEWRIE